MLKIELVKERIGKNSIQFKFKIMSKYWTATVQFETTDNQGKVRKTKETYLVDALSATEAEALVHKEMKKHGETDFQVVSASQSKILRVIE